LRDSSRREVGLRSAIFSVVWIPGKNFKMFSNVLVKSDPACGVPRK
jgi:hypothetical protein